MSVCAVCTSANARKLTCVDSKCKIWDTSEDFKVRRTFGGHSEGVRSVQFSNTGEQFLSSGFDRFIRLWDVETGSAAATFSNRKMAYCVKFYPRDNHLFIAACSDNKVRSWGMEQMHVFAQCMYVWTYVCIYVCMYVCTKCFEYNNSDPICECMCMWAFTIVFAATNIRYK